MLELPSGTVTFLFTDLEGSTRLWEERPQAMAAALARHDALLRHAIETHDGVVFKTVGDAYCAAFALPPAALAAAVAGQRALAGANWGEGGPLRARMALHTGSAEQRAGDYFGPPLNRVARLLAAGHGGQVLLSLATRELIRDTLPAGTELRDLGEHRLKDLVRGEQIFQVVAPGLSGEFPPLRTLDPRRHNLPLQPTPLVGREREVETARRLLERDDVRLLTLTGPGGTGKTRLGLQVAAELTEGYADGVLFVPLAAVADPALVAPTIAATLGVREAGDQPLLAAVREALGDRHLLLLLDNFEQVAVAAPLVADLLAACPRLDVLVTSRAGLRLRGEREFAVPPLGLPDPKRLPALAALARVEAIRLFVERARDVRPDFALAEENAATVAAICHRLDGLPLAIELAAARIKLLPPRALLPRLERRLALLTGGARDLPARQQTLHAAIAWSHDLLGPDEQALFRRLATCAGGFDLVAAVAIAGDSGREDADLEVLLRLGHLVDHSLLRLEDTATGDGRYRMLETIREYGQERLAASDEAVEARQRHAAHFLALAERAEPDLRGAAQGVWLARLETEHDNLRAALACAIERDEPATALRLGGALWRFWQVRGHLSEGRVWLDRALGLPPTAPPVVRVRALNGAGVLAELQEDHGQAVALHERSLALAREIDDRLGIARALGDLGYVALNRGDLPRAATLFEEALARRRDLGDTEGTALQIVNLGEIARHQGDLAQAATRYEEALGLFRELGNAFRAEIALGNLAAVARAEGDLARAAARSREALLLQREIGDQEGVAYSLSGLAGIAADRGQPERAARLLGAAAALCEDLGITLQPLERAQFERDAATARAALGEAAFADAWTAGHATPTETVVADVVEVGGP